MAITQAQKKITIIAVIDHGFSFPLDQFHHYRLKTWPEFIDDFCDHWPTNVERMDVDFIRDRE